MRHSVVDKFLDMCESGTYDVEEYTIMEKWLCQLDWVGINRWPFRRGYAWYDDVVKRGKQRGRSKVAALAQTATSKVCS